MATGLLKDFLAAQKRDDAAEKERWAQLRIDMRTGECIVDVADAKAYAQFDNCGGLEICDSDNVVYLGEKEARNLYDLLTRAFGK